MRLLLDTHLLIWAAQGSPRLSQTCRALIDDVDNAVLFSAASIWEVAIKAARLRTGFQLDPTAFRNRLLANGYSEVRISGAHGVRAAQLELPQKDPFDRMLLAQAIEESFTLLTADAALAAYGPPVTAV